MIYNYYDLEPVILVKELITGYKRTIRIFYNFIAK